MVEKYCCDFDGKIDPKIKRKHPPPAIAYVCDPEDVVKVRSYWDHQKFQITVPLILKLMEGKRIILDNGESTFEIYYTEDK